MKTEDRINDALRQYAEDMGIAVIKGTKGFTINLKGELDHVSQFQTDMKIARKKAIIKIFHIFQGGN